MEQIKENIRNRFKENGKNMEGIIFFFNTLNRYSYTVGIQNTVFVLTRNDVSDVHYFKITKRGLVVK